MYFCQDCDKYKDSKCDDYFVVEQKYGSDLEICGVCMEKREEEKDRYEHFQGIHEAGAI